MSVFLLCYADGPAVHLRNQQALVRSAAGKGVDTVLAYQRRDLTEALWRDHRHILEGRRGAGYWLWKPLLIHDCLLRTAAEDVVVYMDAGIVIRHPLAPLIAQAREFQLVLFGGSRRNAAYVKRDCFVLTGTDDPACHAARQVDASVMLIKNTEANRRFVKVWLDYCTDDRVLTDQPNQCGAPNLPEFVDHRHDQAVLSVLFWRERARLDHVLRTQGLKRQYLLHHRRRRETMPILVWHYRALARRWRRDLMGRMWKALRGPEHPGARVKPPAAPGPP